MIATLVKRRVVVARFVAQGYINYKLVEIRLPNNVKKVTGIMATASTKPSIDD